jgi:hypothetical protein
MSAEASPRPWLLGKGYEQQEPGVYITDGAGRVIYADGEHKDGDPGENLSWENARLIVEAVNAYTEDQKRPPPGHNYDCGCRYCTRMSEKRS